MGTPKLDREGILDFLVLGAISYVVVGILLLVLPRDPSVEKWVWWTVFAASPLVLAILPLVGIGIVFAAVAICLLCKKWFYDPFSDYWKTLGGTILATIEAPINHLEERAKEAEKARKWRRADIYRKFANAVLPAAILLIVVIVCALTGWIPAASSQ